MSKTYNIDALLRLPDVENISGYKKSKIYNLMAENNFPQPVRLGKRTVRWKSSEISSWINNLSSSQNTGK
jgi:prophage regulatory protein